MIVGGAVVASIIIGSFLQYWFFKFKREGEKILINDGVLKKNYRVIQFDRIQNINILQPLYFKPFELVTLQIETAGAKGNEADLAGISVSFAEYLRNEIMQNKGDNTDSDLESDEQYSDKVQVVATASLIDLVKYGISSNGIFWFFIFLAPLIGMADDLLPKIVSKEELQQFVLLLGGGVLGDILVILVVSLSVILLMLGFSVVGAILRYYNYSLILTAQREKVHTLKRTSGLLTRYEESLKLQKIQSMVNQTNFIGRWLDVEHITLGQVSSGQNNNKNKKSLFIVPSSNGEKTKEIASLIFDDVPSHVETSGINFRYVAKTIIFKLFLPTLILSLILFVNIGNYWIFTSPFLLSLVMLPLIIRRWKCYRYGMENGYAQFKRGLFGYRNILFPLYKVQRAEVRQSPFQRRRNLATLKIYLASDSIQMQYIPIKDANRWLKIIGQEIELTKQAWY